MSEAQAAQPQVDPNQSYAIVKIGDGFAVYNEKENQISLVADPQQSTVFPADVAAEVEKALKTNGVEQPIQIVPVTIKDDAAEQPAAAAKDESADS